MKSSSRLTNILGLSRTPHGVRGLKSLRMVVDTRTSLSHPTRGAWIEIFDMLDAGTGIGVAPHTGCVD